MSKISDKDIETLIRLPNELLGDYHARIILIDAPESLLSFYEKNQSKINGKVVIVRNKDDEATAAQARNNSDKVLFVFSHEFLFVDSYFSGVSKSFSFSKTLIKRSLKW